MAKIDNRKRVIVLKSVRKFSSIPTGAVEYAQRVDGAIFTRKLNRSGLAHASFTKWERLDDHKKADFLRDAGGLFVSINGTAFTVKQTTRLRLPQDLGV